MNNGNKPAKGTVAVKKSFRIIPYFKRTKSYFYPTCNYTFTVLLLHCNFILTLFAITDKRTCTVPYKE